MNQFLADDILPPPPEGADVLHDREYRVQSYRLAPDRLEIRGALRDQKPPGLFVEDDPDPITVHHMVLAIEIVLPELRIEKVTTRFETHPHSSCPSIIDHYDKLIGLSIARGFTHKVRELFGGPRGCSHTTALLQAMAPIAMQSVGSMQVTNARADGTIDSPQHREQTGNRWQRLVNTCHVWSEDGELVSIARRGEPLERALPFVKRLEELGRDWPE